MMELNLVLSKMLWKYNLELINSQLDWEKDSRLYVMWCKPELMVRFSEVKLN